MRPSNVPVFYSLLCRLLVRDADCLPFAVAADRSPPLHREEAAWRGSAREGACRPQSSATRCPGDRLLQNFD